MNLIVNCETITDIIQIMLLKVNNPGELTNVDSQALDYIRNCDCKNCEFIFEKIHGTPKIN